jgi:hypothetical protein
MRTSMAVNRGSKALEHEACGIENAVASGHIMDIGEMNYLKR